MPVLHGIRNGRGARVVPSRHRGPLRVPDLFCAPVFATRLRVTANPRGMQILHFASKNRQEINLALNDDLLHSFL